MPHTITCITILSDLPKPVYSKTKLRGMSPWANYKRPTDRRLLAKLLPTFAASKIY
jgi:hypothetical protein